MLGVFVRLLAACSRTNSKDGELELSWSSAKALLRRTKIDAAKARISTLIEIGLVSSSYRVGFVSIRVRNWAKIQGFTSTSESESEKERGGHAKTDTPRGDSSPEEKASPRRRARKKRTGKRTNGRRGRAQEEAPLDLFEAQGIAPPSPRLVDALLETPPPGLHPTEQDVRDWYLVTVRKMKLLGRKNFPRTARRWWPRANEREIADARAGAQLLRIEANRGKLAEAQPEEQLDASGDQFDILETGG